MSGRERLLSGLAEAIGHPAGELGSVPILGLKADSRQVKPGDVFFALPGSRDDGSRFAASAAAAGATLVVGAAPRPADLPLTVSYWQVAEARLALAKAAAWFHGAQPPVIVAVTGTAGKTSVAEFSRQIFATLGHKAASLGTLGLITETGADYGALTTPDPLTLHATLARLAGAGITHVALEASSHGLDQRRLDGLRLAAGAFTNLGRDHLDYHRDMASYLAAKLRLFEALLPRGAPAVINLDGERSGEVVVAAGLAGCRVIGTGAAGLDLTLVSRVEEPGRQRLVLRHAGEEQGVLLPLVGAFQAQNALVAAGLAIATGEMPARVIAALATLRGVPGRLERIGSADPAVYVDYSHKPEALAHVLEALRPSVKGRLVCVFGCGGDRDAGKRPLMGQIASEGADVVIVTDDNPRSEDPQAIRRAILDAAPGALEIGDRRAAIRAGVAMLKPDDALVICGKGHETGQIIGSEVLPFDDRAEAATALAARPAAQPRGPLPLWTAAALAEATGGKAVGRPPAAIDGISIDSRTLQKGDAFFAVLGDTRDGHDFVPAAFANGAGLAVVSRERAQDFAGSGPLLVVDDVLQALVALGREARARSAAKAVAVTGSVGKTSTKEMLRLVFERQGRTHASVASYNNHWGVPLTLARMPKKTQTGIFEIGMNHSFEILPLTRLVRPDVALITTVAPVHLASFHAIEGIADAKGEIFSGLVPGGTAIIHHDNPYAARLRAHAGASPAGRIITFGEGAGADVRLTGLRMGPDFSTVEARVFGIDVAYRVGAPGRHLVENSLAVLAVVHALGADLALAALALPDYRAGDGRGQRITLAVGRSGVVLIDESYNANPSSMRAAISITEATPTGRGGRRIAVLGDMLELGPDGPRLHAELAQPLAEAGIDLVFAAGPLMKNLFHALPADLKGAYAETSDGLESPLLGALREGDVVMVKGSNGSRMGRIVAALKARYGDAAAQDG